MILNPLYILMRRPSLPVCIRPSKKMLPMNSYTESNQLWGIIASAMGVMAFSQTLLATLLPLLRTRLRLFKKLFGSHSSYCYFEIKDSVAVHTNLLYNDVQLYISSNLISAPAAGHRDASRLTLTRIGKSSTIIFGLSTDQEIPDTYNNVPLLWKHVVSKPRKSHSRHSSDDDHEPSEGEKQCFTLCLRKRDRQMILDSYLDYIMRTAAGIRRKNQERLLYTNSKDLYGYSERSNPWHCVPFKHPSTLDTLAMDPDKKEEIMNDLKDFAYGGQSFYQKTGRAWKRGYLLYGPPGTGKSSLIAAMANFLSYDIYDLELTEVSSNSQLRKLLMKTTSKSIIVIEDIDCTINLTNRNSGRKTGMKTEQQEAIDKMTSEKLTLSGLLNFTDGLWSCCGSERIFVFTTNHIEKLDAALLRSGRMDMHIFMSYCTFESLKILLKNYLDYTEDDLSGLVWDELEQLTDKARMTPADTSEHLIKHKRNKDKAIQELIEAMKLKVEGNAGAEANEKPDKPEKLAGENHK